MNKYITINDFSKKTNIPKPTIYRKAKNEWSDYCIFENNRKLISTELVNIIIGENKNNDIDNDKELSICCEQIVSENCENVDTISVLKETISILKYQILQKDNQINSLIEALSKKDDDQKTNFLKRIFQRCING